MNLNPVFRFGKGQATAPMVPQWYLKECKCKRDGCIKSFKKLTKRQKYCSRKCFWAGYLKKWRARQKQLGLCLDCSKPVYKDRVRCLEHLQKNASHKR